MTPALPTIGADSTERFINRELSWLAFNERVLEEARNPGAPLLERVRFLAISATNLNEFYMVRVAGLNGQVEAGVTVASQDGMTPAEQLAAIAVRSRALMDDQQECWEALVAEMRDHGIFVLDESELGDADRSDLEEHFMSEIFPVLSPSRATPRIPSRSSPTSGSAWSSGACATRRSRCSGSFRSPRGSGGFVRLPGRDERFIPVEQVIRAFVGRLFPGFRIEDSGVCGCSATATWRSRRRPRTSSGSSNACSESGAGARSSG